MRDLPVFQFSKILFPNETPRYSPTSEWIFPSVIPTEHLQKPLAKWYMYYSPHDAPGGICLATSDSPEGPWTEYAANPLIKNIWNPHYAVSHVASPHALWMKDEKKLFLWFHGENDTTRLATSTDGIHFDYEGVALSTKDFDGISECSYARVFEHAIPSKKSRYLFSMMGNEGGTRKLFLAWSKDGRNWTAERKPWIPPPAGSGGQTSAPWLFSWKGRLYILHHCDLMNSYGDFYATEINAEAEVCGETFLFHKALAGFPDETRVADVHILETEKELLMFYIAGQRLKGKIALAKAAKS